MTSPGDGPGPLRAHLDAAVASAGLQLTKDNVLFFRDSIINEANRIRHDLIRHEQAATTMPLLGGDPVSYDASRAFPIKLKALMKEVEQFADDLEAAGHALDDTARRYGITEDEISRDFGHAQPVDTVQPLGDAARGSQTGELLTTLATDVPATTPTLGLPGLAIDEILDPHLHGDG